MTPAPAQPQQQQPTPPAIQPQACITITTCSYPTDQAGPPPQVQTRTSRVSATTPSRHHPRQTPTADVPHAQSMRKKKCTLSGITASTCARSGKRCARASIASSPAGRDADSRVFNASSTGLSRRRNVPRCVNRGE